MHSYRELIEGLKSEALKEPNIRFAGSKDIYELNSLPDIDYGVFYITPNAHRWYEDYVTFSLNLYYIDRWDETDEDQLIIHSDGMRKLMNIVNRFRDNNQFVWVNWNGTFNQFYQRFKDITAGVWLTMEFSIPVEMICGEEYEN